MKNWFLILAFGGIGLAIFEQATEKPNPIVMAIAIVLAFFGIMKFSSKLPSKHKKEEDDDVQKRG